MKIQILPNNEIINPKEFRDIAFVKTFTKPKTGVTLNIDTLTLVRENYKSVKNEIYNGQGRFENIPLLITSNDGTPFDYYLDLDNGEIGLDTINLGIQERKSHHHFFKNAKYLTFELVNKDGFFPASIVVDVPYIVVPEDVQLKIIVILFQDLSLLSEVVNAAIELGTLITMYLSAPFTIAMAIGQTVLVLFQLALLTSLIIDSAIRTKELIFPKLRYFQCISDYNLIKQACLSMGYTLDSHLLSVELGAIHSMGIPESVPSKSIFDFEQNALDVHFNKPYPRSRDTVDTLEKLIDHILVTYNAKIFVFEGVVKIERDAYFQDNASVTIVPTLSNQGEHDDSYMFNDSEAWGRSYDHYQVDYDDVHTLDLEYGMKTEYITEPITVNNPDLLRLTGLRENSIPFTLASRKHDFNLVEKQALKLLTNYDALVSALGSSSNSVDGINKRIGAMVISQQYFSITKKLWLEVDQNTLIGKQPSWFLDALSVDNIYINFKQDLEVKVNNKKLRTMLVPFTDENFTSLLQNNYCFLKGTTEKIEVVRIEYNDTKHSAELSFYQKDTSAFNTKTTKLI